MENGKILMGGVGTGKSRTAIAYWFSHVCDGRFPINGVGSFKPMNTPTDLYIITTKKKRDEGDWLSELVLFMISSSPENSYGGVKVVIDTWHNIQKYKEVENAFFIFDEQRLVGSGAWAKAFIKISKKNQWIVLSATPGDVWTDYIPIFVANGFYKHRTEFLETHAVYSRYSKYPKIDSFVNQGRLIAIRKQLLVDMPYRRKTKRHDYQIFCEYDEAQLKTIVEKRWNPWDDEPIQNISQLFYLMRRSVNSDPSRLSELSKVLQDVPRLIIFYNFNYELDALREFLSAEGINYSEWNGKNHQPIPDTDSWVYLVQYTAGAEGWNCVTTDSILFYSLNYSWKIIEQSKGRTDRMNTKHTDLHYYFLRSNSSIDKSILKALDRKEKFNELDQARDWGIEIKES